MDGIVNGIASGAAAGLVVSGVLGLVALVVKRWKRCNQARHIRGIMTSGKESIYSVSEESAPRDPEKPPPEAFRYLHFEYMRREAELALDGRSSEITFDEIRQIRRLFIVDDLIRRADLNPNPSLQFYHNFFGDLKKIKWLKLPERYGGEPPA